ncbi:hypothetical protein [Vibrio quintilis]|uniref:Uncharacterized protein n=1 Tax=Vibrio quintilis TaxID=1117707 RepID=A0A1M7Z1Y4_9VIBR|nr:hypothetical protein [Vibrio quintilis]SHO58903.1 hypothetical protein VQ7734_04678 [Vibrio quintilis]
MAFKLKKYTAPHDVITQTDYAPTQSYDHKYSQFGWDPDLRDSGVVIGNKYRLDGDGPNRVIKITAIGVASNSSTYTREGLA